MDTADERLLLIDFQRAFSHDTVSLKLNDHLIFKNVVITTDKITDFAEVRINVYTLTKGKIVVSYLGENDNWFKFPGKVYEFESDTSMIILSLEINKTESQYTVYP